jgi:restriction endonuclease fold toxin 3 of polymorphic toxin system
VRIDRSDPADGPGGVHISRRIRSSYDDLDATDKDRGTAVDGDGRSDASLARTDSTLQTERNVAYRAVVDAAYRQYASDRNDARVETLGSETATAGVNQIDVEDPERYPVVLADGLRGNGQQAESAVNSPQAVADTDQVIRDGSTLADRNAGMRNPATRKEGQELHAVVVGALDEPPATPSGGGDGSVGNGGDTQPPAGDTPPNPEGEGEAPEGMNGGLGELVGVNAKDQAAHLLAERLDGEASMRFANGPGNEFDTVSSEYVAQAKPANFTLNQAFRNQAKVTFEVALQSGRTPYFQFDGPPGPGVLPALSRYADRYGIEPVIDLTPLEEADA